MPRYGRGCKAKHDALKRHVALVADHSVPFQLARVSRMPWQSSARRPETTASPLRARQATTPAPPAPARVRRPLSSCLSTYEFSSSTTPCCCSLPTCR
jgi:hypothetical protein